MQQPDVTTPARRAAVRIEDRIRRDAAETAALIAPDGTLLVMRQGLPDRVHLTDSELIGAAGATFTHNHPHGHGFSLEDVRLGAQFRLHEVRVVTAIHRHGVSMLKRSHVTPLNALFEVEETRVIRAMREEVRRGLLHPTDFSAEVRDRTWRRMSSLLGFHYWREST